MSARLTVFVFWFAVFMLLYLGVVFWISDRTVCVSSQIVTVESPIPPATCN